jgi:hypothetical protein
MHANIKALHIFKNQLSISVINNHHGSLTKKQFKRCRQIYAVGLHQKSNGIYPKKLKE